VECANVVLEYGANANVRSEADSDTPMHKAVREGHMPVVKLLLKHRADLSVSARPLYAVKASERHARNGHITSTARAALSHTASTHAQSVLPHPRLHYRLLTLCPGAY
jgi:ankyrin repeat protein